MGNKQVEWRSLVWDLFTNPFRTAQGIIEYFLAWFFTRRWKSLIGFSPVLVLLSTLAGFAIYGWSVDHRKLAGKYARWNDEELDARKQLTKTKSVNAEKSRLMEVEDVSPYGELLLQRILQLENSDSRSRYLVALQMGSRGRRGQARQMMRQLAPKQSEGLAPAHAWLAIDRIVQGPITNDASKLDLLHDLEIAVKWSGAGTPLKMILAELLEKEGRIGDAIKTLQHAAESDPVAWIPLIAVSLRNGRKQPAEDASAKAQRIFNDRIKQHSASAMDYINLARIYLLESRADEAILQVNSAMKLYPDDPNLKLVLSECYRIQFLGSCRETPDGITCDIALLDEALKADPTNPAVGEEVAKLLARGGDASEALSKSLESQLAEGKATTLTHLMLATFTLKQGKLEAAIPHLEVALRNAPDAPVVLNNLAVALVRVSPSNAERARRLIDRAIQIRGPNAEMFDSQGEIRMSAGDYVGAVESFESAIGQDGSRIDSRKRLVEAYEKAGLTDMIPVQQAKIRELEAAAAPALPTR